MSSSGFGLSDLQFVQNASPLSHLSAIKNACAQADAVSVCVAYLRMSGLASLQDALLTLIEARAHLTLIFGTDHFLTEPKALRAVFNLVEGVANAEAYIVLSGQCSFHPKLLFARHGANAHILVGSANWTGGGMHSNNEASVCLRLPNDSELCRQVDGYIASVKTTASRLDAVVMGNMSADTMCIRKGEITLKRKQKRSLLRYQIWTKRSLDAI